MSDREPKLRALWHYAEGELSRESQERVEAYLEAHPEDTQALDDIERYRAVREDVRTSDPDVNFAAMEMAIRRMAKEEARRALLRRRIGPAVGIVAAAAAAAIVMWPRSAPAPSVPGESAPQVAEAPAVPTPSVPEAPAPATAFILGTLGAETDGSAIGLGTTLEEGQTVRVDAGGRIDIALLPETTATLMGPAEMTIARLREGEVALSLAEGEVGCVVKTGTEFAVDAGDTLVEVRGTRFAVTREGESASVRLLEGHVRATRGTVIRELHAPAFLPATGPDGRASQRPEGDAPEPVAALPYAPFDGLPGTLSLGALEDRAELQLDDVSIGPVGAEFALRAAAGERSLRLTFEDGRVAHQIVPVSEGMATLRDWSVESAPAARPRRGTLAVEDIQPVVRRGQRGLRRCYERVLRNRPSTSGRLRLRISVASSGLVTRAAVSGADVPEALRSCIAAQARGWRFPPPHGGPVSIAVPLNLSAR